MKKNLWLKYVMLFVAVTCLFTGCGKTQEKKDKTKMATAEEVSYALPKAGEAGIIENQGEVAQKGTIAVATVGSPNTEILQEAGRLLKKKGYLLKIEICEDYFMPNQLLQEGKVDCNFYQHEAFLERYNLEQRTNLRQMAKIYYSPMVIYSEKVVSLSQIPQEAKVAVPSHPTALSQALLLLQDEGLLTLAEDADLMTVMDDITENPKNLQLLPMEESVIMEKTGENELSVCRMDYGLNLAMDIQENILAREGKESLAARKLAQAIVVSEDPNEKARMLTEVLMSEEMQEFLRINYHGSIYMMEPEDIEDVSGGETEDNQKEEEKGEGR